MIKSMTGYGKGQASRNDISLTVEVKSVNHRYSDVAVKVPRTLMVLEGEIRKQVAARLKRGRVDVYINLEFASDADKVPVLNRALADHYLQLLEGMERTFELTGGVSVQLLAAQKDVITLKEAEPAVEDVRHCLEVALDHALKTVEGMRLAEGSATCEDMQERFARLETLLADAAQRAPMIPQEWRLKLQERLARLEKGFELDPQRVAQEIAIFADRCDISEELTRFKSHLQQFATLFESDEPVGRQMDFLVQELNRETNTMGSKSNDVDLTRQVVTIKSELEKIREQVQNIE